MNVRLQIARIMFVATAVAIIGGGVMINRSNGSYQKLKSDIADLTAQRDTIRTQLVETKLASKAYSKSLTQMPDSTRLETAAQLSATMNNYNKKSIVLSNQELGHTQAIDDLRAKSATARLQLRRDIVTAGSSVLLTFTIGVLLLWSSKSAFRT